MEIAVWQICVLTVYAFFAVYDQFHFDLGLNRPLIAGWFTGLVMGDMALGLAIGATLQLQILGVSSYGGSVVPDYMGAAVIGTALCVVAGEDMGFGMGLAVPVGLLMVQLDILGRMCNTFIQHKADRYAREGDLKKIEIINLMGNLNWGLSRAIPVAVFLTFGTEITQTVLNFLPAWLMNGLKIAGGLLPAVGIAILLRYLPVRKYYAYLLIGFLFAAYLKVPMLGIAIAGTALASIAYRRAETAQPAVLTGGVDEDE